MTEMTPRRQAILGLVIRAYVEKGAPVGSKMFVDSYGLNVSPATIRNEMAILEELGYLTHPHTSAGRVPTEKGYRYFVQHLVGDTVLPPAQQLMIRHQFHQARLELDQWVKLAVAVLAHTTHKAALATAPRAREGKFKHLELISLRDTLILMVLVLEGGAVKQEMLTLDEPVDQAELSRISNEYNDRFVGLSALAISESTGMLHGLNRRIRGVMVQALMALDRQDNEPMYRDGLVHVLGEPEFFEGPAGAPYAQHSGRPIAGGCRHSGSRAFGNWRGAGADRRRRALAGFVGTEPGAIALRRAGRGQRPAGRAGADAHDI